MTEKIEFSQVEPAAYQAMLGLEQYLYRSGLDNKLLSLIKVRASQINKCAFCIDMHTIAACDRGDLTGLIELLAADITLYSDGGGKVQALLKPIEGGNKVARFLIALGRSKLIPRYDLELVRANGQIGILYSLEVVVQNIATFEFTCDRIQGIYFVRNPDKLSRVFSSETNSYL